MRSLLVVSLLFTLFPFLCISATGTSQTPQADPDPDPSSSLNGSYPNLHITDATQYTLWDIFTNPQLIQDPKNITYIFNITRIHAGHIPGAQKQLETGVYTLWLPDDEALLEAKPRWEKKLQEQNFTGVDLNKTWSGGETNSTVLKETMSWTHAGLAWSATKGNITLSSLTPGENLLTTCLNDTKFVALGKNKTTGNNIYQKMRIVKSDVLHVYGKNITMDHSNRTNVMIISGSGFNKTQIGHVYRAIFAKNGVVYILDRAVDLPLNTTDQLKTENATLFLKGIAKSELNTTFDNTPNVTIFVPSDEAIERTMRDYAKLSPEKANKKWSKEELKAIMLPYIVNGTYYAQDFNTTTPPTLRSLSNITHPVSRSALGEVLLYGNISVIASNILTRNGVSHIINDTFRALEQEMEKRTHKPKQFRGFF